MPKRIIELFIVDIFIAIDRIKRNLNNITNTDEFASLNENIFDAIMRELEIIGEASKYIIKNENYSKESPTEWQKIINFRNIITHEYFGIDLDIVFNTTKNEIPKLEEELLELALKFNHNPNLALAIQDTIQELSKMKRTASIKYLENLEKFLKS